MSSLVGGRKRVSLSQARNLRTEKAAHAQGGVKKGARGVRRVRDRPAGGLKAAGAQLTTICS